MMKFKLLSVLVVKIEFCRPIRDFSLQFFAGTAAHYIIGSRLW